MPISLDRTAQVLSSLLPLFPPQAPFDPGRHEELTNSPSRAACNMSETSRKAEHVPCLDCMLHVDEGLYTCTGHDVDVDCNYCWTHPEVHVCNPVSIDWRRYNPLCAVLLTQLQVPDAFRKEAASLATFARACNPTPYHPVYSSLKAALDNFNVRVRKHLNKQGLP